jgi:hypothetical protein
MDKSKLTHVERQARMTVRNFLLTATHDELKRELAISKEVNNDFRAACIQELIDEQFPLTTAFERACEAFDTITAASFYGPKFRAVLCGNPKALAAAETLADAVKAVAATQPS